jgi:hypothetical protein
MSSRRPRIAAFRVPVWLFVLALVPVGIFLASLLAAGGIVLLAVAALALFGRFFATSSANESLAPRRENGTDTIELDPSEYRRIPAATERDRR